MVQKGTTVTTGTQARAEILLHDYNRYRAHTFHLQQLRERHPVRDLGPKKGIPLFTKLDEWCQSQSIDARRWLYHLFKIRKWIHAPALNSLIPAKTSLARRVATYREMTDTPFFSATLRQGADQQALADGKTLDRNRDLMPLAEIMKARYRGEGKPERCLQEMWEHTYGYHPKSKSCVGCPLADRCAQELQAKVPFDIGALRRGELSIQEAQMISNRSGHGA